MPSLTACPKLISAGDDLVRKSLVDVLEVHVQHASGVRGGEGDRVGAPDDEVAGVDAEADVRPGDDPFGLLAALDHRADVGVEGCDHAALGRAVADPVEVAEHHGPALVVEHGAGVVPVDSGEGGEDHDAGAGRQAAVDEGVHLRDRVVRRRRAAARGGSLRPPGGGRPPAAWPSPRARPRGSRPGRTPSRPARARACRRGPSGRRAGSPSRGPRRLPTRSARPRCGSGRGRTSAAP